MKKPYEAPRLQVEEYRLERAIASNCGIVVSNGPEAEGHRQCDDYQDPFGTSTASTYSVHNVQFYEDTICDCYTTGGDYGYWMS